MVKVLLVEDSQTQAFHIKTKLTDEGYDVRISTNGQEALETIPEYWPHLILTDLEMPVLNGFELTLQAREQYPTIPIILITAEGSEARAVEALERGAAAYLPKSMLDERLFTTMDEVLDVMEGSDFDELIKRMDYSEYRFTLENDEELILPLVDFCKQILGGIGLCDDTEGVRVGLALEHALRNAMLHGNLELTTEVIEADSELEIEGELNLVQQRAQQPKYEGRRVHVTIQLTPQEAKIVVRDDGSGFDIAKLPVNETGHLLGPENGRGLVLIHSLMDEVKFNENGNEITLFKRSRCAP